MSDETGSRNSDAGTAPPQAGELPRGHLPTIGVRELVAAIHRRREQRRGAATQLAAGIGRLAASLDFHLARVAELRRAIDAEGGDLAALEHHDAVLARLQAELRAAEGSLGDAAGTDAP